MKLKNIYKKHILLKKKNGSIKLPFRANHMYQEVPRAMLFSLARYKFVSKILSGYNHVLEVGCGDGFFSRVVHSEVKNLSLSDFDLTYLNEAKRIHSNNQWKCNIIHHDILSNKILSSKGKKFKAAYSMDTLEHIKKSDEKKYFTNICAALEKDGVFICGMPSLESQKYASPISKKGHVNCKSGDNFKKIFKKYFKNVFMFSMNDEVLHTGYFKMSHYLIAVGVGILK